MKNMKTTNQILNEIFRERNSSENTQKSYARSVNQFEIYFEQHLGEILIIAETEEDQGIPWRKSTLRQYLIEFRSYLYNKYKSKTAKLYLTLIISIFRHYEFVIPKLPRFSEDIEVIPILPEDIPDREMLQKCLDVSPQIVAVFALFTSSSGMSRRDALNLKVKDYLKATKEYHDNMDNVSAAIKEMNECGMDIIPVFEHLVRQKTGLPYFTFASPEAAEAINNYLISRKVLVYDETGKVTGARDVTPEDDLFDVSYQWIGDLFEEINTKLSLGKAGRYNRFTIHMMRRYHATQLHAAGMSEDKINLLQGRTPKSVIHESYIRVKVEDLKQEYIDCLPYIVISEVDKVRTKLDVEIEKNIKLETELTNKKQEIESMNDRLSAIENMIYANDGLVRVVDRFKK
ncbi:MAG: hypothetical protein IJQ68_05465 [Methanobrevibacter sp.]|uniref:hypothetical protein n=1 Tax=Methanobrevibacter sp. TaxID=66852 RepID=UPI0025D890F5|nr:hypothetical protein [Methanobrevibacter sp.]MBR0271425.1 hypothetical protein [Methanobrevibacter sp.]